ncbi:nucleoside 2-deoxyribosyltransferase [Candidatus Berkelbacteria bacterium]|nr:nucleoside 2-deoxyribosyltransferase [Candidatus Berkelbacteria bacterium]
MKIYFAGSIRGGRGDVRRYAQLIESLRAYGEVLTEHVGSKTLSAQGELHLPEAHIYHRDMSWLAEADVVVAEVTTPSLGVGYELAAAERFHKPVLCLYRHHPDQRVSAMVRGNANLRLNEYRSASDVATLLREFFLKLPQTAKRVTVQT